MTGLHETARPKLCKICTGIDVRKPFCGPEHSKSSSCTTTRICYSHAQSLHELLTSAIDNHCHLCCLILDVIRKHYILISNKKNVLDDWDYVDDLEDFSDDEAESGLSPETSQRYRRSFCEADNTFDDATDTSSPIVLEFVFRSPLRDELPSRWTDVAVHWTQAGGLSRLTTTTSALSLVSRLPENLIRLCEARDVQNDTDTSGAYSSALVRLWTNKCDQTHELCRARREQRQISLPTRVIEVAADTFNPRLVESQGQTAGYVCLSHCWGKSPTFKTEVASLSNRKRGMDIKEMPKTFQDAVAITRNLGMRYLWIDSLCIVQDSADDWARESAQMGRIYQDAAVTIFAESSDSDAGGCFASRPQVGRTSALCRTPMLDSLMQAFSDEERQTPTFIQEKLHHAGSHSLPERHSVFETVKNLETRTTPLSSRGWVLQESILSFRALVYDQHEVRWSCPTMKACECTPEGHIRQSWSKLDKGEAKVVDKRDLSNAWVSIVHKFSRRKLTYSRDKLPALAGIAGEMSHDKRPTQYLAGLWEDDLRHNLAWFVPPRSTVAPYRETNRTQGCHAPSWSWAAVDGEVRMHLQLSDDRQTSEDWAVERTRRAESLLCEILVSRTTPINKLNPFGDCTGMLRVCGPLGYAKCCSLTTTSHHVDRIPLADTWSGRQTAWFDPDVSPVPRESPIDEVWCMPLYHTSGHLWCLALTPVPTNRGSNVIGGRSSLQGEVYQRVGIVTAKYVSSHEILTEPVKHFGTTVEQNNAILAWFEQCEVKTITIV